MKANDKENAKSYKKGGKYGVAEEDKSFLHDH